MKDYGLIDGVSAVFLFFFFFNFRDVGKYEGAPAFFAYDVKAGGGAEEGDEPLVDVDEADLVSSLVADEKSSSLSGRDADAGVPYVDFEVVRVFDEADLDFSASLFFEDAVDDGVFYKRLEKERRYLYAVDLPFREFVGDFEFVAKSCFFQFGVAFDDVKFFSKGDES